VAEAELPPDEALSALSDPQAPAIMVNAIPRAIRTRRFRRMVPSKCVCEFSVSDVEKGEHTRRETEVTPVTALTVRYGTVLSSSRADKVQTQILRGVFPVGDAPAKYGSVLVGGIEHGGRDQW
jgi:hypothetical protein